MEKLRIVFMGTPDFAVGILDALMQNHYSVVGVITAADKPAGRGQKMNFSAVKEYALAKQLTLLQPANLKDVGFIEELKSLQANCQVVVAFRMLPEVVWKMPKYGTFNLHASLLPNYRGAAPINWAIINGEKKTGVTTFFIDNNIDTGAIILKEETNIEPNENAGQLHDRLMQIGCKTVIKTLQLIENNTVTTSIQMDTPEIKTAYKLNRDNCKINWQKTGIEIFNLIRGLSPHPTAWCIIKDGEEEWTVKIYEATFEVCNHSLPIGKIQMSKKEIKVVVQDGLIHIHTIQFPGKRKMVSAELLNGMTFSEHVQVL